MGVFKEFMRRSGWRKVAILKAETIHLTNMITILKTIVANKNDQLTELSDKYRALVDAYDAKCIDLKKLENEHWRFINQCKSILVKKHEVN